MHVAPAGNDVVAPFGAPLVGLGGVRDAVHGLAVWGPVELLLGDHVADVELELVEGTYWGCRSRPSR